VGDEKLIIISVTVRGIKLFSVMVGLLGLGVRVGVMANVYRVLLF